jgi:hypothetical protein
VPLTKKGAKDFIAKHKDLLDKAVFTIVLVQSRIKLRYNSRRKDVTFKVGDKVYLKLAKGTDNGYRLLDNFTKLFFTKIDPYCITEMVTLLSFRLDLPE